MVCTFVAFDFSGFEIELLESVEVEFAGFHGAGCCIALYGRACRYRLFSCKECCSECAHEVSVGVNDDGSTQLVLERFYYANVFGYAALEYHGSNDVFAFADVVEVIDGNGFAQAGDDVFACVAYLNFVDQVALCEYRAASCDVCGLLRGQSDFAELLYLHAKAMGLAGKEGARVCCTQRVHSVIDRDAAIYADDFAVLTADLQDGTNVGVQKCGAYGVDGNLILDYRCTAHGANEAACAAGCSHCSYRNFDFG